MKKTLFILTAAAGMLLLGGVSAKADDGSWTITVAPSTGTFYRDSDGDTSNVWKDRWVSTASPTITVADADGSTTNNMTFDTTLDGITLAEGSGSSYGYTVSVEYGYLISGMTVTVQTNANDMTVTIGSETVTSEDSIKTVTLSNVGTQSVGITVSSSSGSTESATLYGWTVTVVKDPDAKDISVDLSHMKITAISEAITSQPEEGKWYLMKNDRQGDTGNYGYWSPVCDNGEGEKLHRAAADNVVQVGDVAEDVAQYLLRFFTADTTSTKLTKSVVVNPQWATGNFWTSSLTTTSDFGSAGSYNMYLTSSTTGTNTFAFNLYDMGSIVDNNGVDKDLDFWSSGEVTATTSGNNNIWWLYEVTIEEDEAYFDLTHQKIDSIGEPITEMPTSASQWYLIKNNRRGVYHDNMTPAYDNGEGNTMMRASEDHLQVGDPVEEVAQYLIRFLPTGETSTSLAKSTVVNLQWATGNYWTKELTTSSHEADAGSYNMYLTADGGDTFAFNLYDMGSIVDNNGGSGDNLAFWSTGEVTATSDANNIWWLYPVTFEEMTEEDDVAEEELIDLRELIEEVQAAYDAYTVSGYNTNVETGFSDNDGVGNGLITIASQFSSPCSDEDEGKSFDALLDNNVGTFWHSDWHSKYTGGTHYLQVEMLDDFVGGPLLVNILRRSNANNDHITTMTIKSVSVADDGTETETEIGDIDLPFEGLGTRALAGFTCPYGVKTLRFYNKATTTGNAYFHLAEFQLFYTTIDPDISELINDELSALATAIAAAQAKADDIIGITQADIDTLTAALTTCKDAVEARTESAPCTLTEAKWGTLILPFDYDAPGGIMAYTSNGVDDDELQLTLVEDGKLKANTPYIIGGVASSYTLTSIKISEAGDSLTNGTLTGTFDLMYAPAGSYVLQDHGEGAAFYQVAADNSIQVGAYHCYLNAQSGGDAKAVVYFPGTAKEDGGVATAIEAVETAPLAGSEAIYDLSGRKVTNPRSGIYIKGGKKVIIK